MPSRATHRDEQPAGVALDHLDERHPRLLARAFHLLEQGALGDRHADPQPDQHERAGEEERNSPAPGQERVLGEQQVEQAQHTRGEQVTHRDADLRPACVEASTVGGPVLE